MLETVFRGTSEEEHWIKTHGEGVCQGHDLGRPPPGRTGSSEEARDTKRRTGQRNAIKEADKLDISAQANHCLTLGLCFPLQKTKGFGLG